MSRTALLMVLSCTVPLALIWAMPYIGITATTTKFLLLVIVLCPLLHLLFMAGHGRDSGPPSREDRPQNRNDHAAADEIAGKALGPAVRHSATASSGPEAPKSS